MLGNCYIQNPQKLHWPSSLTHHTVARSLLHVTTQSLSASPFPLLSLQSPTNVKVTLAPSSAVGSEEESCTGLVGQGHLELSGSSEPPDLGPLASLSPCPPIVQCAEAILALKSYKA